MDTSPTWRLKRYGRFLPGSTGKGPWKVKYSRPGLGMAELPEDLSQNEQNQHRFWVSQCIFLGWYCPHTEVKIARNRVLLVFEANANEPDMFLTIVESGYLLVLKGQESLDTIPLHLGSDFLKAHQKSDNLMFRFTVKGESRMMRMQFDGSSRAEAIKECSGAVEKLTEYMSVTTQGATPLPPNQPPAEVSAPVIQGKAMGAEPEVVQGPLSIKRLAQHFLGETALTLPQVYHHSSLAHGDLEPILRVCLLDPSFLAFVEKMEGELRKLLQE